MDERSKNDRMLIEFLSTGRGIPFATLFALKDYPSDILPLYAQGYSLSMFLIGQGGPRKFVQFLETGVSTEDWIGALAKHYEYDRLGKLQVAWNQWVADGGGEVANYTAVAMNNRNGSASLASNANPPSGSNVALASANAPISQAQVPAGRLAVGRTPESAQVISDGFEPVSANSNVLPTDPRSLQVASNDNIASAQAQSLVPNAWQSRTNVASASNGANMTAGSRAASTEYDFQPNWTHFQPYKCASAALPGVGTSPAAIQFGPAEPLIR